MAVTRLRLAEPQTEAEIFTLYFTKEIGMKLFDLSVQRTTTVWRSMQHAYGDYSVFVRHISYSNSNTEGTFFMMEGGGQVLKFSVCTSS